MPTAKKPRTRGVTYKLVPRSYGDADGDEGPVWVSEAEFYRNHQSAAVAEDDDRAQHQFNMYAAAANAEFKEERRNRRRRAGEEALENMDGEEARAVAYAGEGGDEEGEEGEWVEGDWMEEGEEGEWVYGDEEGEWEEEEGEWEEEEPETAAPPAAAAAVAAPAPAKKVSFAPAGHASPPAPPSSAVAATAAVTGRARGREEKRARDDVEAAEGHPAESAESAEEEEEEEEEKLFDDEVDCEITDDFLRQLVFGNGGGKGGAGDAYAMGDDDDEEDEEDEDDDWDGLDQEDGEMWRLLTDEEKAAIRESRRRGTARRRRHAAGEGDVSRTHAADGTEYPMHDVTQRALDRQFTEMMREFNADARLNDANTDDPRTHGALPMEKYMAALEEFVTDRAGMDVETAEPHKNKGLIQQLRFLSHHAGAFDSDSHGTYLTTMLPEKQQRFVEEFQKGTEEIRRAARMRLAQRHNAAIAASLITTTAGGAGTSGEAVAPGGEEGEEDKEDMIILEVKPKVDRMDCETALSAYSTYYNQPNVIQAPRKAMPARRARRTVGVVSGNVISAAGDSTTAPATKPKKAQRPVSSDDDDSEDSETTAMARRAEAADQLGTDIIPTVRPKGETKEEKKLRRQAVKAAQRERRQAKSALKSMYKDVESEEVKRSTTSQAARRTVHFM